MILNVVFILPFTPLSDLGTIAGTGFIRPIPQKHEEIIIDVIQPA